MRAHRGVALVVALLVVALATVLIAGLLDRGELAAARTRNLLRNEQADAYSRGLELYAARVLEKDLEQNRNDSAGDLWAMPLPPTDVPGGRIAARMRDMNGCFNLNNLLSGDGNEAEWRERFRRLLTALRLDPTLTETVIDWIDADGEPGGGGHGSGAEDSVYGAAVPSYRAANRSFAHASELRLLQGFGGSVYTALAPHVCALPRGSLLNLNTATIPVLQSLNTRITEEVARRLWDEGRANWEGVGEFRQELLNLAIPFDATQERGLTTSSRYFLARGDIQLDGLLFHPTSLIDRERGVRVLQRSRGD
ncbi:MAG TPA: type II secretion system minor pseudopilin GspK [Tahibacter sp.]|uniref:type II secretion system minor pseudopilin GspK n=1 Tax=Tahibacter sp. TaxID=2056211 RepID=UPI002BBF670C|nr:type II secretion system minor pseudopilin GspK [Tahibacter sp.]HSX60282.1 type II secretion system minor pseudopilin GspK [Tahibacter sp.]